jgi:integrase
MLRQKGFDVKTAQELLRHANSRTTMDLYQQSVSEEKRQAQELTFRGMFSSADLQHPSAPSEGV